MCLKSPKQSFIPTSMLVGLGSFLPFAAASLNVRYGDIRVLKLYRFRAYASTQAFSTKKRTDMRGMACRGPLSLNDTRTTAPAAISGGSEPPDKLRTSCGYGARTAGESYSQGRGSRLRYLAFSDSVLAILLSSTTFKSGSNHLKLP